MSDEDGISKTRRKRQAHDAQALGVALGRLRPDQLAAFSLPERLHQAIVDIQGMTKHEAVRRQRQFIGKLMRDIDLEPIAARLAALQAPASRETARFHRAERWRTEMLEDATAVERFVAEFPDADAAALSLLVEEAKREREAERSPRRYRELFHLISQHLGEPNKPDTP